jgi:hypothetical protein
VTLTKREKTIAIVLGTALVLFAGDYFLLSPYLAARKKINEDTKTVDAQLTKAKNLVNNKASVNAEWRKLEAAGLTSSTAETESQALHSMRDWAAAAGVGLQSLRPDRATQVGDFQQIRVSATGVSTSARIARLLWSIETADFPMQINELRLSSRKDGVDDLSLQLSVTTIAFSPQPAKVVKKALPKGDSR